MASPNEDDVSYGACHMLSILANLTLGLRKAEEQDGSGRAEAATRRAQCAVRRPTTQIAGEARRAGMLSIDTTGVYADFKLRSMTILPFR